MWFRLIFFGIFKILYNFKVKDFSYLFYPDSLIVYILPHLLYNNLCVHVCVCMYIFSEPFYSKLMISCSFITKFFKVYFQKERNSLTWQLYCCQWCRQTFNIHFLLKFWVSFKRNLRTHRYNQVKPIDAVCFLYWLTLESRSPPSPISDAQILSYVFLSLQVLG